MKKVLLACMALLFTACIRENHATHHHVETDSYILTVDGKRLSSQEEADRFPKDTMMTSLGDTIRLHDEVTSVAQDIEMLASGWYRWTEPYHYKGSYVLSLELVHRPNSDHQANYSATLLQLKDWGYIDIDTINWQKITIVRRGKTPQDYTGETSSYSSTPYEIDIPQALLSDTVDGATTLGEWIDGWMDARFETNNELFSFLSSNGYDTVHTDTHTQIYPHASIAYQDKFLGLL